ncbi:MAG: hypothetical protein ACOX18_05490 [Bacillota bacterium]|jgi:hypothetical protein
MRGITVYPDYGPLRWKEERQWSHLIKLPGVKSGMRIPVTCRLTSCQHRIVTPRRVRVQAEIDLSTEEIRLQSDQGPRVRWKSAPEVIPCVSASVTINHMIVIPKDQPAILQVSDFQAKGCVELVTVLRDRVIVKGSLKMQLEAMTRRG